MTSRSGRQGRGRRWLWLALLAVVLINLPLVHSTWTQHRLDTDGKTTTATVTETQTIPKSGRNQRHYVTFTLPADLPGVDKSVTSTAEVDQKTFKEAKESKQIKVTYLPDNPTDNRPHGAADAGQVALWITVLANLALAGAVALMLWVRRTQNLEIQATRDVIRCKPESLIEELDDGEFLVRGDVLKMSDRSIVLQLDAGRQVRVVLGDFTNPVGYQQPAEVRGTRISR